VGWLAVASEQLRGRDQSVWVGRAERDTENVRAAIGWALDNRNEPLAFDMLVGVDVPPLHGLPVGRVVWATAGQVLELVRAGSGEHLPRAVALGAIGAVVQGDFERARALLDEASALDDGTDDYLAFDLLGAQNNLGLMTGDVRQAMKANALSVSLARRTGRSFELAGSLSGLAAQHANGGDFDSARAEANEAVELARRVGATSLLTAAHAALAFAMVGSDPDGARTQLRALISPTALPPWSDTSVEAALATMMVCAARLDELDATLLAGARVLDDTPSSPLFLGAVLETAAAVLAARAPEEAATLRGATDTIVPGFADILSLRSDTAAASETATPAYKTGQRMTEDEATAYARTLIRDTLATLRRPSPHH
jgi:hypothetical protein